MSDYHASNEVAEDLDLGRPLVFADIVDDETFPISRLDDGQVYCFECLREHGRFHCADQVRFGCSGFLVSGASAVPCASVRGFQ